MNSSNQIKLAFFDLDGTIFRFVTSIEVYKEIMKVDKEFKNYWKTNLLPKLELWENRQNMLNPFIKELSEKYSKFVANNSELNLKLTKKVITKNIKKLNSFTKIEIEKYKKLGVPCIIISDANQSIVDHVVEKLWFTKGFWSSSFVDKKGEIISIRLKEHQKADKLKEISELYWIPLSKCSAYWDTHIDYQMLQCVEYPFAINPIKELIELIKKDWNLSNKINIIVEKKGVIYKFLPIRDNIEFTYIV